MKTLSLKAATILITSILIVRNVSGQDYINVQNIFDTGVNLGYISSHSQAGTGANLISTWQDYAKTEWAASMSPTPFPLVLEKPIPSGVSLDIQNIEFRLMMLSNACPNPWFSSAKMIFLSGLSLSRSYVIAGGACTGCLRDEIILTANYLEVASRKLVANGMPEGSIMKTIADNLKISALNMRNYGDAQSAAKQNFDLAPTILNAKVALDSLLRDQNLSCSGFIPEPNAPSTHCDEVNRNHHIFNAGVTVGLLNYATMIDVSIEQISVNGWYIDDAISHYTKSCCLDPSYLIDLKKRMASSTSSRQFYNEITTHFTSIGSDLADCHCDQVNSTSIYSAGIALGWAEFAAHQNVSADYIANNYLDTAITHIQASYCLDASAFVQIKSQMSGKVSSKGLYKSIQQNRIKLSEATISSCQCSEQSPSPNESNKPETVVERTSICGEVNEAGGDAPERHTIQFSKTTGNFVFSFNTISIPDRLQVFNGSALLYDSDCVGTNGWKDVPLTLQGSDQVIVNIIPNCNGTSSTQWSFKVSCPDEVTTHTSSGKPTGFNPGKTDKVLNPSTVSTGNQTSNSSTSNSSSIPVAPVGPKNGEWWYPVENDHPWRGKDLEEIVALGGKLQMDVARSMAPDEYYLTDLQGRWINYNPGTHGPSTYYYVDWDAFNGLYNLEETKPISTTPEYYKSITYKRKDQKSSKTFRVYRQGDFNPQIHFGQEVYSWAMDKNHPWFGKDLQALNIKPFMYFSHTMDHNTMIYKDPFGQLITSNARWGNKMYILDWGRFTMNFSMISEAHMRQTWKHNIDGFKKYVNWL